MWRLEIGILRIKIGGYDQWPCPTNIYHAYFSWSFVSNYGLLYDRVNIHNLGLYLSSSLIWSLQVRELCLKINRKLSVLRRIKLLSRQTLDLSWGPMRQTEILKTSLSWVVPSSVVWVEVELNWGWVELRLSWVETELELKLS